MKQVHTNYVLQHRDKVNPSREWHDHMEDISKEWLMSEVWRLSKEGTAGKEYRVVERVETEMLRFTGLRDILDDLED